MLQGLSAKMGHMVNDWGEVCGAVELHLWQALLVGEGYAFYTYKTCKNS